MRPKHIPCIGLFGTCGVSRWREPFIQRYDELSIPYFNPQVATGTWHPGLVAEENRHFHQDSLILFPVTAETTGQGSLAEIGFSVANALRQAQDRFFLFLVEEDCHDTSADDTSRADSVRSRALVKSKLLDAAGRYPNILLVDSRSDMLDLSVSLFRWLSQKEVLDSELGRILNYRPAFVSGF